MTDSDRDGEKDSIYNIDGLVNISASGGDTESSLFNFEPDIGDGSTWGLDLTDISAKWDFLNAPSWMNNSEVEEVWDTLRDGVYDAFDPTDDVYGEHGLFFDGFDEGPTEDYSGAPEPNLGDFDCGGGTTAAILEANTGLNKPIVVYNIDTGPVWEYLWNQANDEVESGW